MAASVDSAMGSPAGPRAKAMHGGREQNRCFVRNFRRETTRQRHDADIRRALQQSRIQHLAQLAGYGVQGKPSLSEKKDQKTSVCLRARQPDKSFLFLFFKKRKPSLPSRYEAREFHAHGQESPHT